MSKFWEAPDHSACINLDKVIYVSLNDDESIEVVLPELGQSIHMKKPWAQLLIAALKERA